MSQPTNSGNSWLGLVWAHLEKDLRIEWRSWQALTSMLFYALLVVVLFSIAFDPTADVSRRSGRERTWVHACPEIVRGPSSICTAQSHHGAIRSQTTRALPKTPADGSARLGLGVESCS